MANQVNCHDYNRGVCSDVFDPNGNALTNGDLVDLINGLWERMNDAESVIESINRLHDGALSEVRNERDRCFQALRAIKKEYRHKMINGGTSTLGLFVDQVLDGCPNYKRAE